MLRAKLANYKSLRDVELVLPQLATYLIGVNESGKSSILGCLYAGLRKDSIPQDELTYGIELEDTSLLLSVSLQTPELLVKDIRRVAPKNYRIPRIITFDFFVDGNYELRDEAFIDFSLSEIELRKLATAFANFPIIKGVIDNLGPETDMDVAVSALSAEFGNHSIKMPDNLKSLEKYMLSTFLTLKSCMPSCIYVDKDFQLESSYAINADTVFGNESAIYHLLQLGGIDPSQPHKTLSTGMNYARNATRIKNSLERFINSQLENLDYSITLHYNAGELILMISDSIDENPYPLSLRSDGFRKLLSIAVLLDNVSRSKASWLLLFDEPTEQLHPGAQTMLGRIIEESLRRNAVSYALVATHSPYILQPHVPESIKIVRRETVSYGGQQVGNVRVSSLDKADDRSIQVLRDAIELHLANEIPSIGGKRVVIVEGYTEYYILAGIIESDVEKGLTGSIIVPATGAGNIHSLSNLVASLGGEYLVLVDNDPAGRKVLAGMEKSAMPGGRWMSVTDNDGDTIEDIFSWEDYTAGVQEAYEQVFPDIGEALASHHEEGQNAARAGRVFFGKYKTSLDKLLVARKLRARVASGEISDDTKARIQNLITRMLQSSQTR